MTVNETTFDRDTKQHRHLQPYVTKDIYQCVKPIKHNQLQQTTRR